jgi:MEDS: MEthanogen/methylotroph, DcmR Sensory domain
MVLYLSRDQLSYFKSYKNYFTAIYLVFLGFPSADLIFATFSDPFLLRLATQLMVTSGAAIATIWGYVATKLYMYPQPLSLRRLIDRPFRPIYLVYATYLIPMILAVVLVWSDSSLISTGPNFNVTYLLEGTTLPSAPVGPQLLALGGVIVSTFTVYPLAIISRRRALVKDREVRAALRIIASVFGIISATLILGIGLSSFGYSVLGPINMLSVILIIIAVHAFRQPTFLKSFLGVVPSLQSSPTASHYDQMILIYGPGNEKFGATAKYILDGVNQRERVIYFHNDDVAVLTDGLSREGVNVRQLMLKGALRVQPLASAYPSRVQLDDTPLEMIQQLAREAKTLGYEALRVVIDFDNFVVRPAQKFVDHLIDPRWTTPDHQLHVLMAFDSDAFRGDEGALAKLEHEVRTLDLSESADTFSQTVGLTHAEIAGRKLLFEFDPQADYEPIFKSLLAEIASNFERTVAITRKESPVYTLVQNQPAAKIFVLTSRVSYPKMEGENLILLPTYDTSLLLDALNKTIEAYAGSAFTIMFDNISHYVLTLGPERTYSLVRQALELMVSNTITAVFSINYKAHDQRVMSTFENMFDLELVSRPGSGPEIMKKLSVPS